MQLWIFILYRSKIRFIYFWISKVLYKYKDDSSLFFQYTFVLNFFYGYLIEKYVHLLFVPFLFIFSFIRKLFSCINKFSKFVINHFLNNFYSYERFAIINLKSKANKFRYNYRIFRSCFNYIFGTRNSIFNLF